MQPSACGHTCACRAKACVTAACAHHMCACACVRACTCVIGAAKRQCTPGGDAKRLCPSSGSLSLCACPHCAPAPCLDCHSCLKRAKARLQPMCKSAVTMRQAAAAEDLSLDPDLQRECGSERESLCLEWG